VLRGDGGGGGGAVVAPKIAVPVRRGSRFTW
jgi:hypothetical protein